MISPVKIWRNQKKIVSLLGLVGKIITYTKIHVPPVGFESQAPYVVAIAKLSNGKNYTAQLVQYNEKELKIGLCVKTILRKTKDPGEEGIIPYGIKFKPV
jgi:uncharacterized OB-fold protein